MTNIPFIGSGTSSSSDDGDSSGGVLSANLILISGLLFVLALVLGGALDVPQGTGIQVVVALELLAVYLLLHELDAYSFGGFVAVGAVTTLIALSATGEPVLASLLNSGPGIILVLGVLYLGYRWLKQRERSRPKIVVESFRQGGNK